MIAGRCKVEGRGRGRGQEEGEGERGRRRCPTGCPKLLPQDTRPDGEAILSDRPLSSGIHEAFVRPAGERFGATEEGS